MAALQILVVDDNRSAADALALVLRKGGHQVRALYSGGEAIEVLDRENPDVVLTDLKMGPVDGIAVLEAARARRPPAEVIVFTAYGAVDIAVEAMRLGARDFLTKPVPADLLIHRLEQIQSERTNKGEAQAVADSPPFIAQASSSIKLLETLKRAAGVPSPLWIEGETGTGRGHAALTVHRIGTPDAPFTVRDLGRDEPWPESGTVLIPNVDDLPDDLQRRLHRDLRYVPPGLRLIATAGPGASQRLGEGMLRPELYYALAVVVVQVPPLRQRREDVLPIADAALANFAQRYKRPRPTLGEAQRRHLEQHSWPGNVRELLNLAERTVVLGSDSFQLEVVPSDGPGLPRFTEGFSLAGYLEGIERQVLIEALKQANGDRNEAGRLLGVERNTLRYKLNKYGLLSR